MIPLRLLKDLLDTRGRQRQSLWREALRVRTTFSKASTIVKRGSSDRTIASSFPGLELYSILSLRSTSLNHLDST